MWQTPIPHAAVLSGPIGQHDPEAERLRAAARDRQAIRLLRAKRLQRWSGRLAVVSGRLSIAAHVLQARAGRPGFR